MRIAILGATSQIARDLIISFSKRVEDDLHLFARRPDFLNQWLVAHDLNGRYLVDDFSAFGKQNFDAVINFVGVGNPATSISMGHSILDTTYRFDQMVLDYLNNHHNCRYLFLSSGAVYGSNFTEPVNDTSTAIFPINQSSVQDWYGIAKFYAESRHRSLSDLSIIDIRLFNYFSCTQDINARFFISDILRAIRNNSVLKTSSEYIVRDYLHPFDFYCLVVALLSSPTSNSAVDCYSLAPIDKPSLLEAMRDSFGLVYEVDDANSQVNATGTKPYYYSMNKSAELFGFIPSFTSLEGVVTQARDILHLA